MTTMKKALLLIAAIISLASCSKQGTAVYRGYYSFKTGGSLDIEGKVYDIERDTVKIDTTIREITIGGRTIKDTSYRYHIIADTIAVRDTAFTKHLVAESGQMHILNDSGNDMYVTMNITGGDPVVFKATVTGGDIILSPSPRTVTIRPDDSDSDRTVLCDMEVSGRGHRYDNMILFNLTYLGKYSYDDLDGSVKNSRVDCIATENE